MLPELTLGTTLGILNGAASILGNDKVRGAAGRAARLGDRAATTGGAITAFSAQTNILSRAFIDSAVSNEPILPNLLRTAHEWYAAQIIAAMHLSQMVDGHRTVQDVMSVLQTGHNRRERGVLGNIASSRFGQESFLENYRGTRLDYLSGAGLEALDCALEAVEGDKEPAVTSVNSVSTSDNRIGPMGELYEVKISNPNDKTSSIVVPIMIQVQPSFVDHDIAPRFIDMNVSPSLWQRWTQMTSGELRFWKDFVFNVDLINRQRSILKDPEKAKAFSSYLKTIAMKDKYALDDLTDSVKSRQSANLANSIVIFSEETIAQAKADSGIDLHNPRDRQRYFKDTYTMMLIAVDSLHQCVTVYFNGVDGEVNTSYNDFRPKDSKFDPKEFMTALQAFSSNNVNRLR